MLAGVELDGVLGDAVFLVITVAFFTLAWLVVRLCEKISGPLTDAVTGPQTAGRGEVDR